MKLLVGTAYSFMCTSVTVQLSMVPPASFLICFKNTLKKVIHNKFETCWRSSETADIPVEHWERDGSAPCYLCKREIGSPAISSLCTSFRCKCSSDTRLTDKHISCHLLWMKCTVYAYQINPDTRMRKNTDIWVLSKMWNAHIQTLLQRLSYKKQVKKVIYIFFWVYTWYLIYIW